MKNNMVIEFKDNGEKRALDGLYTYNHQERGVKVNVRK